MIGAKTLHDVAARTTGVVKKGGTSGDSTATGEDAEQTALDRNATGEDAEQTALDRVATGEDVSATAANLASFQNRVKTTTITPTAADGEEGDIWFLLE
jgi:hypothetical protein